MRQSERTFKCYMNLLDDLEAKLSYDEIGKKYNLSPSYIRGTIVTRIASEIGVPREELLYYPGRGNFTGNGGPITIVKPVNLTKFWPDYEVKKEEMKAMIERVKKEEETV